MKKRELQQELDHILKMTEQQQLLRYKSMRDDDEFKKCAEQEMELGEMKMKLAEGAGDEVRDQKMRDIQQSIGKSEAEQSTVAAMNQANEPPAKPNPINPPTMQIKSKLVSNNLIDLNEH